MSGRSPLLAWRMPVAVHANDNAGTTAILSADGRLTISCAVAPEPLWEGPGAVIAMGVRDGRHGLGLVRAAGGDPQEVDSALDPSVLRRLLIHYGLWLGFDGEAETVAAGELRRLPVPVGRPGRVEYRLDLRRIGRRAQALTADGTILLDGRPAATVEGLSIAFRSPQSQARRAARPALSPA
ncbi:hypothetical protein EAH89_23485 [Roseomonas nepalensis]|uniref:Uncharacterized protein n=1 Tax=Muricoccus nepalensis TaxID=1854500 RepID=A0A502FD73_9PROT|nr:hypothetical protein [Roseomonas nepalensis]TPG47271.1 hypothetical protein EAH89_23485 [Roseomonas nepalensis]